MEKCIVCGSDLAKGSKSVYTREIKLPHGSFYLCENRDCFRALSLECNGNIHVATFSVGELEDIEACSQEILDKLTTADVIRLGARYQEIIWEQPDLGTLTNNTLEDLGGEIEKEFVSKIPENDLPLYTNFEFCSSEAEELFKERLSKRS